MNGPVVWPNFILSIGRLRDAKLKQPTFNNGVSRV